jgi:ATP-dependent DNA helicase RecG
MDRTRTNEKTATADGGGSARDGLLFGPGPAAPPAVPPLPLRPTEPPPPDPPDSAPTPRDSPLAVPVTQIRGVGEKVAELLAKLGLYTVEDLLTHFPRRYEDRSRFVRIADLRDGEAATVVGKVTAVENRPTKNRLVLTRVSLDDGSRGVVTLVWFNQWRMKQTFEKLLGRRLVAYGIVKRGYSAVEISQPEWEALDDRAEPDDAPGLESLSLGRIVPIYALTDGLAQNRLRKIVYLAVERYAGRAADPLPPAILGDRALPRLGDALRAIHFPETLGQLENARRRLVYDELLVMQLLLAARKLAAQHAPGIAFADTRSPLAEFEQELPFALTAAQQRALGEIAADMAAPHAMNRLVQGDVGSGKTAVAMGAMVIAARNGYQAALMAPTEILAEQHLCSIRERLEALGIRVDLLTGSRPAREKAAVRERVASGETGVVVGTHALIQEGVRFRRLGLAVIDEQHRFGVLQRAALSDKGAATPPDVLVMTATPIPRTLTLTVYGDLDVSLIDELPPGRKPVKTHWKRSADKPSVYEGVRRLLEVGRQAYVVCPLVEESDKLQARAATELAAHLALHVFPEYKVGLLHGQMPADEKDDVMSRFRSGALHVLVATTVIEVGVDVANAAVMVIEDADRFGLAQLHQLRGRVGRGQHASFCVLIADPKGPEGEERMSVLCATNDGFRIAEEDLRLRGPGELSGTQQSGLPALRIADLLRDTAILREARADAFALLGSDPDLSRQEHRALREAVLARRRELDLIRAA